MPSYESSLRNLAKARAAWRPPRPWRSEGESHMIRRYVFLWYTGRGQKPSGREWAPATQDCLDCPDETSWGNTRCQGQVAARNYVEEFPVGFEGRIQSASGSGDCKHCSPWLE